MPITLSLASKGSRVQVHCSHLKARNISLTHNRLAYLEEAASHLCHSSSAKGLPLVFQDNAILLTGLPLKVGALSSTDCYVIQRIFAVTDHLSMLLAKDLHQMSEKFVNELLYSSLFVVLN